MFTRLTTLFSLFAILLQLPTVLAGSTPPASGITNKPKPCPTCQSGVEPNGIDRLDLLSGFGRHTQVSPFQPLRGSLLKGVNVNFVNTATGNLSFAVTDISVGSAVPVMFQRTYVSDRQEDFGLGIGWSFAFIDRFEINADTATLTDATGKRSFRHDGQSNRFIPLADDANENRQFELTDSNTIVERDSPLNRIYEKIGKYYVLTEIHGPQGINILIDHDERGNPTRIANKPGAAITLEWVGAKQPHLVGVVDNAGHRITFRLEGHMLRGFIDPNGAEWTYEYSGGMLSRVTDPMGRRLLRARYDRDDHAIEVGNNVSLNRYEYQGFTTNASTRTIITDALGAVTTYEHNARGALVAIKDDEGKTLSFEYTAANRPARIRDSANEARFAYDAQNRLLSQATNGSLERAYEYGVDGKPSSITEGSERTDLILDARRQIISSQSSDAARSYTAHYNEQGQMSSLKSAGREVSFGYDSNGNKTSISYADGRLYSFQYDGVGQLISRQLPSGLSLFDERDARGALITERDNQGHALTVEYDAGGAPMAYTRADGTRMSVVRDSIGRVTSLTDFDGKERRFDYDGRGALTDYTDAKGNHRKYQYDHRGRLRTIVDDAGVTTKVERDERGRIRRLISERTLKGDASGGRLQSLVDRRWAHATLLQDDPPIPPLDAILDKIITDTWEPYGYGGSGGYKHPPLRATDSGDGSGGGTDPIDCAMALTGCFLGILLYPALVGALIAACPETFGLTCFAALVALVGTPLLAMLQCARAYHICNLG
jgi:YD repeat-containing protein